MSKQIVVTRHPALVAYLVEIGLIAEGKYILLTHCSSDDIRGQDVIGVLPLHLAVEARTVTEIPLHLEGNQRGKELSLDDVRQMAGTPHMYSVISMQHGCRFQRGSNECCQPWK